MTKGFRLDVETGTPVFQTRPKGNQHERIQHTRMGRARARRVQPRRASSGSPQAGSDWPRGAGSDPQVSQPDGRGGASRHHQRRSRPLQAPPAGRACGPRPGVEREDHRRVECLPPRPRRRRRQAAQKVGCPARVHVKGSKVWRGRASMGARRRKKGKDLRASVLFDWGSCGIA